MGARTAGFALPSYTTTGDTTFLGDGAGEGNRTLVFSLEGCCSTIELHPRPGAREPVRRVPLTRPACRLNRPDRQNPLPRQHRRNRAPCGKFRRFSPLTKHSLRLYWTNHQQRKEVIQCLTRSAVTSLGSPAELTRLGRRGGLGPGPASSKIGTRRADSPPRLYLERRNGPTAKRALPSARRSGGPRTR